MDESAAASTREDTAENKPCGGDSAPENIADPSAEETADRDGVFCCQHCGETFREEASLLEHRHQHLQQNMYLGNQSVSLHNAEKDSEKAYFCTLCSLSFADMSELHLHMKNHDQTSLKESDVVINSGETKQQSYECPDCGKSYVVIGHFLNHQRSHRRPSKSVFHELEHLKKKSFQCESCGRNYSRASALDAHRRCHEEKLVKSKTRSSGEAGQIVESEVEMKPSEAQTEDGSENLCKCSCGKAFSTTMRLKTHQRFSRNSQCSSEEIKHKPKKSSNEFYCSECKKAFNGHIALFNHQRWHANHSDDSAKRFPCEECGKVFMTLTFYYRHQRTAHSDETPAKSFLHQVCQLQKKAFECKDCGLKFSRASALHSHQLQHTDVFKETEKEAQMRSSLSPHNKILESGWKGTEHMESLTEEKVRPVSFFSTGTAEESHISESDEDMESYEPGDFNVQVISASESEDEVEKDVNPDLELLCESDQEVRDDGDVDVFSRSLVSKPEIDLKIVQIDFEQINESAVPVKEAENETAEERYDCSDCYRWFSSPSSLRVHRMWHDMRKRRQQTQGQSVAACICQTCGHEASSYEAYLQHIQTHDDQSPSNDVLNHDEGLEMKTLTCNECGKSFSRLSALVSHQLHHSKRKQFQCPDCMMSYLHAASLFNHMKTCTAEKRENIFVSKKEYNPKKTLLGPKIYHCEQCGKGFWSLGAYSHHKQNQTECVDLRLRKGIPGSLHSVNGRSRSGIKVACPVCGRKFRHKGIMALHMRKHENGNHKCELCSRSFRLFSSLLRHQVVHSDQLLPPPIKSFQHQVEQLKKNTYSCPDCGKLFSRAKALQFHMKSHGYETGHTPSSTAALENLQCAICLSHFSNKGSLRAHQKLCIKRKSQVAIKTEPPENKDLMMQKDGMEHSDQLKTQTDASGELKLDTHTDVGNVDHHSSADLKYKCKKCDRSFSVVGALNFHKRIHAEDKTTKSNLAISLMVKKSKKEEPSKGLFHCSECGRRFTTNSALGSHKRWHREKKCSRSLLKDDDLKPISHKAEDGPFQCTKCGKQFFNHRVLQRHQIFNPQCQTKTEPGSNKSAENDGTPKQFLFPESDGTVEHRSPLASDLEGEHSTIVQAADHENKLLEHNPEQEDINCSQGELLTLTLKTKSHQCPLCSMTFAKARGLRAHKWQAHAKSTKNKEKFPLNVKKEPTDSNSEINKTEDLGPVNNSAVGRGRKKIGSYSQPVKTLDCGNQSSSAGAPPDHKGVGLEVKQESKLEIQTSTADIPSPLGPMSEHSVKCLFLFKCGKCGKAFQSEEQLGTHKLKAKTRPYCCALCCHGFWTENLLQQHLAWHDEVRWRLPNEVRFRLSAAMASKPQKPDNGGMSLPPSTTKQPSLSPPRSGTKWP